MMCSGLPFDLKFRFSMEPVAGNCRQRETAASAAAKRTAQRQQETAQAVRLSTAFQVARGLSGIILLRHSDLGPGFGQLHGTSPPRASACSEPRPGFENHRRAVRQDWIRIRGGKKIGDVEFVGFRQGILREDDVRWNKSGFFDGSDRCRYLGSEQPAKNCQAESRDPHCSDQSRPRTLVRAFARRPTNAFNQP